MAGEEIQSVLVVDDAESSRLLMRTLLKTLSVDEVWEAENGELALQTFKEKRPILTLLDIHMPVMGGYETLKQILRENPASHVVMLTAEGHGDVIDDCLHAGAKDCIRKDMPADKMRSLLQVMLQNAAEA